MLKLSRFILIKRIGLLLNHQIESAALYGESGLWYDMLFSIAKLKSTAPKDIAIAQNWQSLLTEAGLENVVKAEIVE